MFPYATTEYLLEPREHRWKAAVVMAAIAGWFFSQTWRGLRVFFNPDDMMNLHDAWALRAHRLWIANLTPFTTVYRPAGAVFYRLLFDGFGLHALPFRIAVFAFLLANIGLLYWLAKLLTESTEIAILAALVGAYHNRAMDIYLYGGTVYDILCGFFFLLAMCVYVRARRGGSPPGWRAFAGFLALNVLALNSKEMAAMLPIVLLAYEVFYLRPFSFTKSLPLWISLAMTAVVTKIRTGAGTSFAGNAQYAMQISIRDYFLTTRQFLDDLFVLHAGTISTTKAVLILAAVIAIAIVARRRDLGLCAAMILLLPLPVNFIAFRGFFVMYLPLAAWSIFAGTVAVALRDDLLRRVWHRPALPKGTWEPERVALFGFVMYALWNIYAHDAARRMTDVNPAVGRVKTLVESLERVGAPVAQGGAVLIEKSDFLENERWTPLYIVRLYYRDASLAVDVAAGDRKYDLRLVRCDAGYCAAR